MSRLVPINFRPEPLEVIILSYVGFSALQVIPLVLNVWFICELGVFAATVVIAFTLTSYLIVSGIFQRSSRQLHITASFIALYLILDVIFGLMFEGGLAHDRDCSCILTSNSYGLFAVIDCLEEVLLVVLLAIQGQRYKWQVESILLQNDLV
ncbi:hypothetical protein HDE_08664 [Halotydeus destructor]|nr:hypothetical protein HDE_08664 [Halotydeus destructor]